MNEVNFILIGESFDPGSQEWEQSLQLFKFLNKKTQLCLPFTIQPKFLKFKKTTADHLALSTIPFCIGIQAIVSAILIMFINLRSWIWWLFVVPSAIVTSILIYKLLAQIISERKVKIHNSSIDQRVSVVVYDGNPGAGKTSSMMNDLKNLSDLVWSKICNDYKMFEPFLEEIKFWPQKQKEEALEIIEAHGFYERSGTYPCLWSTVPAFVDGVPVNKLTADHLLQNKRLPYGAVCILDETSLILPQELYKDKPYEIIEMCKFVRHFGDFHYGSTEQDEDSNIIYFRRVAGRSVHLLEQKWIQQPRFLQWIYDVLFKIFMKKNVTKNKVNFFKKFKTYLKAFGYRKYYYYESGSSQIQTYLLKPNLCLDYDDRCYRNAYRCLDKPLVESKWEYLRPSKRDIDEIFPDELKNKSKKEKKKEAIERRKNNAKKSKNKTPS